MRHRSVISSRSRRRTSRSSDGVRRGSSSRSSSAAQRRSATSAVRRRASVGWAVRTRVDRTGARAARRAPRSVRPGSAQRADGLGHRIVEDAVARGPLAAPERPDPPARLDEVDQLEVEREGADDRLGRPEIEAGEVLVETAALVGVVVLAQRDRPPADALDELEQLRAGLLGDDLAEQRAHQADLGRRACPGRRRSRSRPAPRARPTDGRAARRGGSRGPTLRTVPVRNLSPAATFLGADLPYACKVMAMSTARPGAARRSRARRGPRPRPTPARPVRARPAALPPPGPAPGDDRADLGRAARDGRRRDPRRACTRTSPPCTCWTGMERT